ncbi:hypothetical protein MTR67_026775 [Solanum verrucosum]|uniref:HECT-type E3 ubiquitin transferase n=1 Tax=Solanum verrucosum TaxID=315347 RepID=A0AAF0R674_SOLVR|nr:hypothetical protein MTR67_026775 [Solanum verrucosum]
MMMLPKVEDDEHDQYYMLIDRSKLLVDSFEYIAKLKNMPGSFFVEFKEEQATGPGVLRAWFLLASQEIFNPNNGLFVACPDDNRSFFTKSRNISHLPFVLAGAFEVNPLHLEYFRFSGRMTALALAYDVQIGVVFYRIFFLQLAGKGVLLEDIRDADPFLYCGCKEILNMDAKTVDQDVLGLTFVCEVESLGLRREIELCPNGKDTVVDSKNMETYVNLLIQHHYVTSIADQVTYFLDGFSDVITMSRLPTFFQCLSLEDFNLMLGGRSDISVEDWKAHTDYHGYEESDLQISWFWKIVESMCIEQRKMLIFLWTSIKSLPLEGFVGLDSRLSIHKTSEFDDHLPSSHTCFYQLCFPVYQSMKDMEDRLKMITKGYIGSSFGTV